MVALGGPADDAIGQRPDNGGTASGKGPQPIELAQPVTGRQGTGQCPARRLAGAHAETGQHGRRPEHRVAVGHHRQRHHGDPAHQREAQRTPVANAIFQVAEQERAQSRRDIDHEEQHHGLLRLEVHHLFGIDSGERDHHEHASIEEEAHQQQPPKVHEIADAPPGGPDVEDGRHGAVGVLNARLGPVTHEKEHRQRRQQVDDGRDQHRAGHKGFGIASARLHMAHPGQRAPQCQHPAHIAKAPSPSRDAAHCIGLRQLRQIGCAEGLAQGVAVIGDDDQQHRRQDVACMNPVQPHHAGHAYQRDRQQPRLARGPGIHPGADGGHGQHHRQVGKPQDEGPQEGGPAGIAGHHPHKIGAEHRGGDHGGVAGIGKVIAGPGQHLTLGDAVAQRALIEQIHRAPPDTQRIGERGERTGLAEGPGYAGLARPDYQVCRPSARKNRQDSHGGWIVPQMPAKLAA